MEDKSEIQYVTEKNIAVQFLDAEGFSLVDPETGRLSEYSREKIRQAFVLFDQDHDGAWSVGEFNSYLKAIGSQERVTHEDHMRRLLSDIGLDIGSGSKLQLEDIFTLYESQGIEEVQQDLQAININTDSLSTWTIGVDHILPLTSPVAKETPAAPVLATGEELDQEIQKRLEEFDITTVEEIDAIVAEDKAEIQDTNNTLTEPLEVMRSLINTAKARGVDVPLWFHYFDRESTGLLALEAFERALTGVGLGMGFGMGQQAQVPIEKALEPQNLRQVADMFSSDDVNQVDYRRFLQELGIVVQDETPPQPLEVPAPPKSEPVKQIKAKMPQRDRSKSETVKRSAVPKFTKSPRVGRKKLSKSKSTMSISSEATRDDTLPRHFNTLEVQKVFKKLVKTAPEKFMCIWKNLLLHVEEDQLDEPLEITESQLHAVFHQVGFMLDARQMRQFANYILSEKWLENEVIHDDELHEFDQIEGEAKDLLSPVSLPRPESKIAFPASLLKNYFRHIRLNHVQSHLEWRKHKEEAKKKQDEQRIAVFQRALRGERHDLTRKEIENLLITEFVFDQDVLKIEATRAATHWIDLQEGRSIVLKQLRKLIATSDQPEKKLQRQLRLEIRDQRIKFILTDSKELNQLKSSLFDAFSREGTGQAFNYWLEKRASKYTEQQRQLNEWNWMKKKQRMESERWAKDVAPTHQVQRLIETAFSSSSARGLDVNHKLQQLRNSSLLSEGTSPTSTGSRKTTWWNRLSRQNSGNQSIDGAGGIISREACLAAIRDIIPSLKASDQNIKSLFSDPETVRNKLNVQLGTDRGREKLEQVIKTLKSDKTYVNKTDKQMERIALRVLMENELRGGLFSQDNEKVVQGAQKELDIKLQSVESKVKDWTKEKERARKTQQRRKQQQEQKKKARKAERQRQAEEAYKKWKKGSTQKKYYSYKKKSYVSRPAVTSFPEQQEWVNILDPTQAMNYDAKQLAEDIEKIYCDQQAA